MLSLSRVMVIGDHLVDLNDLRLTFKHLQLECGVYRTDFDVSDKQNVDAVMRLIGESCFHALAKLETLNPSVCTLATRTFLKYGKMFHDAFFKRSQILANDYQMLSSFYISYILRVKHLPAQQAIVIRGKRMDLHQRKCCGTLGLRFLH